VPPKWLATCLAPLEWGAHGLSPSGRDVRLALRAADLVDSLERALQPELSAEQALNQPADFGVRVRHLGGVVLHQPAVNFSRLGRLAVPNRNLLDAGRQLRSLGDEAHFQLLRMGQLALFVPDEVELAGVLLPPFLRAWWGMDANLCLVPSLIVTPLRKLETRLCR